MLVDKYMIRKQNESIVLAQIIKHGTISRAEVAKLTGLNKATVSEITASLIEKELVEELGEGSGTKKGGRKPVLMGFNQRAGYTLNFDLGYNYVSSSLTFLDGSFVDTKKIKNFEVNRDNVMEILADIINDHQAKSQSSSTYGLVGITIAIHGIVEDNQIVFTPYYNLDQLDLVAELEQLYDIPVIVENEANLTAVAEATFSSRDAEIVSLSIYSGIGAGVIINEQLHKGKAGKSGEVGHSTLYPNGRPCPCGNQGCLEQYCSEKAVLEAFSQETGLKAELNVLISEYREDNPVVLQLIDEMAFHLSIGVNNLICHFSPETIFLNSAIIRKIPEILSLIKSHLSSSFNQDVALVNSKLGANATLYGAAAISIRRFLELKSLDLTVKES